MRGLDYVHFIPLVNSLKYLAALIEKKKIVDIFEFLLFPLHEHGILYISWKLFINLTFYLRERSTNSDVLIPPMRMP